MISFSSAILCFAQEVDKRGIEEKLLMEARSNIEKYRKGPGHITVTNLQGEPVSNIKIEINQISQDFLFGNLSEEVFRSGLTESEREKFTDMFKGLFNFTELTVKWAPYEPKQGKPEWQKLQQKLDWCVENGIYPKGHTLGWTHDAGTPGWLYQYSPEDATQLYKSRIQNLVGGFKDQISSWDVVNEPVTTIPWELALLDTVGGQNKIDEGSRYKVDGITLDETIPWVGNSFRWAYDADPSGDFVINEFYTIAKVEIREKYYNLIKELLHRGVLVTGIGIQGHEPREMWFSPVEVVATFDMFQELGLPLHITEFTPQSSGKAITGGWREGIWTEEAQAEFAEQFYTLAFGHPSMASIHWWGLSDRFIWLKNGGLIDSDFNPKPVYNRLKKLIKEDWMTKNLQLVTDPKGQVEFKGFFGKYQVILTDSKGSKSTKEIHLKEGEVNQFELIYEGLNPEI
ncbi:endo-1,4-beta-xylanase [Aquiflexum sp.]|uniref:endo-1,4-beta-xylanase n=1 Tax=Aquiflexum sp. TaxID=1872584 RepID=UPI0035943783